MPKMTTKPKTEHAANGALPAKSSKSSSKVSPKKPVGGTKGGFPKRESLWKGPEIDGCTFSMLSRFLCCRERFRLYAIEGLKEKEGFNLRLEYGNMIHVCEEATAAAKDWEAPLLAYAKGLVKKFGNQDSQQIDHWYKVCCCQYPVYLNHWKKHPDVINRKPLFQEKVFDVPYKLPSGRIIRLRGKYDAGDLIAKKLYIQENKARGDVQPEKMLAELPFDFQTGIYLNAASIEFKGLYPLGGCRYNVIRRPLSGGKHSIKQLEGRGAEKKGAETEEQFYKRLREEHIEVDPQFYFYRWKIETLPNDIVKFQQRVLNPVLEQLHDWWEWIKVDPFNPWRIRKLAEIYSDYGEHESLDYATSDAHNRIHWQMPTGVWNPTLEGRQSPYDEIILTGDARGLMKTDTLFPELSNA